VLTREPGGSPGAESIRALLVSGDAGRWDALTDTFLMEAARRDHVEATIRPALARGAWVICDRFTDSTVAYQGHAAGVDRELIARLNDAATGGLRPDLTVIFDLPVDAGLERAAARAGGEDRFERKGRDFHQKLRDGFLAIAKGDPERCVVVSADGEIADIHAMIRSIVAERLGVSFP
jgi:dTMP kinase